MVPVMVDVDRVSLDAMQGTRYRVSLERRTAALLAELGAQVAPGGPHWSNGVGQIEIYVSAQGLQLLRNSSNAVAFRPGKAWWQRSHLVDSAGHFERIDAEISRTGFADVQIVPNVEGLEFNLGADGQARVSAASRDLMQAASASLARSVLSREANALEAPASLSASLAGRGIEGALVKRLTRVDLARLAQSDEVRNILPINLNDSRPLSIDPAALKQAEATGSAEVIVNLRMPLFAAGLSQASMESQRRSHQAALREMLSTVGADATSWQDFSAFGAMSGRLSAAQLRRLASGADRRLLSIESVKPVASTTLATATNMLNMNAAWSNGYRASGQTIVVMDTGVQANHAFLRGPNGASRVTVEGCFGTNRVVAPFTYQSVCPNPNALGDSPVGWAGSGAPVPACSSKFLSQCDHGTHVAGIAAGRSGPAVPAGMQGVAPDASIVALQVFSYDVARREQPQVFNDDLVAALDAAVMALGLNGPPPAPNALRQVTINMSLGGGAATRPCGGVLPAVTNAVALLKAGGVPVVAAAGNDDLSGAIAFPACVPGVVKVSSVANDGVGNRRSYFRFDPEQNRHYGTNLPRPANFPGEAIWVVAGGGNETSITSSVVSAPGTASYRGSSGTSQAAPQVAGLYAAVKAAIETTKQTNPAAPSITVDGVTEWLRGNARVPTPLLMCGARATTCPETLTFDRIRLPAL